MVLLHISVKVFKKKCIEIIKVSPLFFFLKEINQDFFESEEIYKTILFVTNYCY